MQYLGNVSSETKGGKGTFLEQGVIPGYERA